MKHIYGYKLRGIYKCYIQKQAAFVVQLKLPQTKLILDLLSATVTHAGDGVVLHFLLFNVERM